MIWNTLIQLKRELSLTPASRQIAVHATSSSSADIIIDPENDECPADTNLLILLTAAVTTAPKDDSGVANKTVVKAYNAFELQVESNELLNPDQLTELSTYLPYALLPCFSNKHQRCYTISHFAQTLDGRIAAESGDSRWIGNEENLTHAHKMRALCDAILVGSNTLKVDKPRLNVRQVAGEDPIPIVMGNGTHSHDTCDVNAQGLLQITSVEHCSGDNSIRVKDHGGQFDCGEIRKKFHERAFSSVYIEGGSATTSAFLKDNAIDQVQVHISPQILGAGLTGFEFAGATNMDHARTFLNPRFIPIGTHTMFIGEL